MTYCGERNDVRQSARYPVSDHGSDGIDVTLGGLVTPFLVPPVNLAVLAALAQAAGRRRLAGLALTCLLLLAVPLVSDGLIATLEYGQEAGDPAGAEAIVVLGAEVDRLADGRNVPGLLSLQRLRAAAALARRTELPILVSGGGAKRGAQSIAAAMAESLRMDFLTPPRWIEDGSADTWDNARDSKAILAPAGVTTVLLVTNQWHMRRALQAFRIAGLRAIPAPVPSRGRGGIDIDDLIPQVSGWTRSYYALHEWIGLGYYALRASL
jgi:uncharacterized SAM-binding protein YcdF (DUF218 family)